MKRHLNRSRKAILAVGAGIMLAAGAVFLSAHTGQHDFNGVTSEGGRLHSQHPAGLPSQEEDS